MSELPEGWVETSVNQASEDISYGYTASAIHEPKGPKYLRITDIQNSSVNWETVPYCAIPENKISNYELMSGDLVFARTGATTGKSFLIKYCPVTVFASYLIRVRPSSSVLPEFIAWFFQSKSYWDQVSENLSGSAQPNCNATKLSGLIFPLPPLAEQRRIVAKLETLLGKVDACQQRLAKIPVILKRFRQAVLAAACSGELTVDWREENSDIEIASGLLQRIREKRLELASNNKEINQVLEAFSQDQFLSFDEELPSSWTRCQIGKIGIVVNGSTPSRKVADYWNGNIRWVSSGEVRNNLIEETRESITQQGYQNSSVKLLPVGTVLLAMIGEGKTRGQTAILKIDATINQNIAAIVLSHGLIASEYLWRWFQFQYETTRESGSGSGPQALNCQRVRELQFCLPPLAEQQEIVRRVEALFQLADQLEARYKRAKAQVDKLQQSILAKAFRGELVPTEAELARQEGREYEPAAMLLERIRQTREGRQPAVKTPTRKPKDAPPKSTRLPFE